MRDRKVFFLSQFTRFPFRLDLCEDGNIFHMKSFIIIPYHEIQRKKMKEELSIGRIPKQHDYPSSLGFHGRL